jgi:hypothetical protein
MICVNKCSLLGNFDMPSVGDFLLWIVIVHSVAWLIGWALILEYTIGGAAVARGISPNLVHYISLSLMCFILNLWLFFLISTKLKLVRLAFIF